MMGIRIFIGVGCKKMILVSYRVVVVIMVLILIGELKLILRVMIVRIVFMVRRRIVKLLLMD